MDLSTVGGFLVAIVAVVAGAALEHVTLKSMLGISAFLIVIGGSIGATILSHTMAELKRVPRCLKLALAPPRLDYPGMIDYLIQLSEKARRQGLLALQEDLEVADNDLVKRGLTMAVDGTNPDTVEGILDSMIDLQGRELVQTAAVFETAGGYAPTIGIMGTVMGLVTIMGNLTEPDTLGPAIAVAFLATLYGVGSANLLFLPLGAKVKANAKQQAQFNEMIMVGIIGIQAGESPRNLRERLSIYISTSSNSAKGAAGAPEGSLQEET